ncbi:molybdenum cofactor synthesis domain protein [Selenomonas sp. oral taxon 137 str. F0430]|uniref:molybdopterin molybdotransferase MoeA n=1 Tax=Selenomonas sp. oral taxon 137 TaxID=712531 RepID=UPI0001EB20D8|nr:gephyrin-like molybdotransferase Glp [Selenomonas sp. oral taxon 137]EFR40122.1 molybdenum cofactor synthesis domain protein [Selenomonas sp. oral taxon 137 str. F0430]
MELLELEHAVEVLLSYVKTPQTERVPLMEAAGRTAAEDVYAAISNPPFDRSPLDGYTFAAACVAGATAERPVRLRVVGEECAGEFYAGTVGAGETVRIMTGGAIPAGCDCVIRQEDVREGGDAILVPFPLRAHENYCDAGEDVRAGTHIIRKGQTLRAADLAVLASQGHTEAAVYRRPRVAVASTGDELLPPGEPLRPGKIYNSNLFLIAARLKELGLDPVVLGILPDDVEEAAREIAAHAEGIDLFLTTGGVSVGKKDIMHGVVPAMGAERIFWRVNMKPGAPAIAYTRGEMLGIALSGNPFAAYATFELLARPVLARMQGRTEVQLRRIRAKLADAFPKECLGRRFLRARMGDDGLVYLPDQHESGTLYSAAGCDAFVDVPEGTPPLAVGTTVDVVLL